MGTLFRKTIFNKVLHLSWSYAEILNKSNKNVRAILKFDNFITSHAYYNDVTEMGYILLFSTTKKNENKILKFSSNLIASRKKWATYCSGSIFSYILHIVVKNGVRTSLCPMFLFKKLIGYTKFLLLIKQIILKICKITDHYTCIISLYLYCLFLATSGFNATLTRKH